MAEKCKTKHPLNHDGTSQDQRFLNALDPGYVNIHEFTLRDWMKFAYQFSKQLKFFGLEDAVSSVGSWEGFMKSEGEIESLIKESGFVEEEGWITAEERERILNKETSGKIEPHLALFLSFLKLLRIPQGRLNNLTGRHLDFYYKEVLNLSKQKAIPDRVHLIFKLAKNASQEIVLKGSVAEAGNDKNGKLLLYIIPENLVVNRTRVALLKSVYHNVGSALRYAEKSDSSDGLGAKLEGDLPQWQAFGNDIWPTALPGFALASPVLLLKGGTRTITVSLIIRNNDGKAFPEKSKLISGLKVFLSGENDWITASLIDITTTPGGSSGLFQFTVGVDKTQKSIIAYDPAIHGEHFTTGFPVLRILINTGTPDGYNLYATLAGCKLISATIDVEVVDLTDVTVENDDGKLDPSKPFMPFGAYPTSGSNFYLGNSEILRKKWKKFSIGIQWKDKPDFKEYYSGYGNGNIIDNYFKVLVKYVENETWVPLDSDTTQELFGSDISIDLSKKMKVFVRPVFNSNLSVLKKAYSGGALLNEKLYLHPIQEFKSFSLSGKSDYIRITLLNDFFHRDYPQLVLQRIRDKGVLPNPPYTPVISSISLSYNASDSCSFVRDQLEDREEIFNLFISRSIQLFHEHPFGQSEQNLSLKKQCDFIDQVERNSLNLVPEYKSEGEFYIGLEDAEPSGTITLLFQVAEGTEDPLERSFTENETIEWSVLVRNEWKILNSFFISSDTTDNLLKSGIIKLTIPHDAGTEGTLLDPGYIWIRAKLPVQVSHNSVCKLIGVHPNAVNAVFQDNLNDLSHLSTSLPAGTIKKLTDKPSSIKEIQQPYCSFGGSPDESDQSFHVRVSERLRHKNRGINIWDYERLILQAFPSVYKVKCMSHTSIRNDNGYPDYFELSPGSVSVIIIPDLRNRNCFDRLKPRVSRNLLKEIEEYIGKIIPLHVRFQASNPEFEIIHCDFRVRFNEGFDANAYKKALNEDLVRFLSPWASDSTIELHFGGHLYKSEIIRYIEDLPYVDFVSKFKMLHRREENSQFTEEETAVIASDARTILVSDIQHTIGLIENDKVCNE